MWVSVWKPWPLMVFQAVSSLSSLPKPEVLEGRGKKVGPEGSFDSLVLLLAQRQFHCEIATYPNQDIMIDVVYEIERDGRSDRKI